MKLTYRWLRDHLNTPLSPQETGAKLTMAGLELDALSHLGQGLERVFVGFLETVIPHPNAERLTLCQVRLGEERVAVVCGATNHRPGDKVAIARIGAQLANGLTITESTIRGQRSFGMLCSVKELGLAEEANGILILPAEAPEGAPLARVLQRDDFLFDLSITPNRGDCLGVRGIARELAAVTGQELSPLPVSRVAVNPAINAQWPIAIRIEDDEGCPRYGGRIISGVRIAPSPDWLRQRLEAVGIRSINNVVDVTNYLLLDLGHPLHAFDLHRITLPIVVRRAQAGEKLTTLDGQERELTEEMTLIADQNRPLALAGIMGGAESGITDETTAIFLEAAFFDPIRIARSGRRLNLHSDSRFRFERGVDPEGIPLLLEQATRLIVELAGGEAGEIVVQESATPWRPPAPIPYRHRRIMQLGGNLPLTPTEATVLLQRLGCRPVSPPTTQTTPAGEEPLWFQPPSYRHDLRREEDLLEELVRLYGYDRVASTLPVAAVVMPQTDPLAATQAELGTVLGGLGLLEAINYAFVGAELQRLFDRAHTPLALQNPISEEQGFLRTTLTAGLVECAQRNVGRGNQRLRLFEIGRVFLPQTGGELVEQERVAALLGGAMERAWHSQGRNTDFFDLKGIVENLLHALHLPADFRFVPGGPAFLHPGRAAEVVLAGGERLGWLGQLHPELQERFDLPHPIYLFELETDRLARQRRTRSGEQAISRYPATERDFAFLFPLAVPGADILTAIRQQEPRLIRQVTLFDLYMGEHVAAGWKSVGLSVSFQADDHTLVEEEVQKLSDRIIQTMARQFSATLRGAGI